MILDSKKAKTLADHDLLQGIGYGYHKKAIEDHMKKSEKNNPQYHTAKVEPIPGPMRERELSRVNTVDELLDWNKDFVPTVDYPNPYLITGDELDDVAAVIVGRKPAAILPKNDFDEREPKMLAKAKEKGYAVKLLETPIKSDEEANAPIYIVGKAESVENIEKILGMPNSSQKDVLLCKELGYPQKAIDFLINRRLADGGYR